MTRPLIWLFAFTSLFLPMFAAADKVYIRDVIYVPLRGGQSTEHRILHQGLRSGTVLERLEENEDTGFSLVRTERGLEGWIQTQYLVTEPIARDQLDATKAALEESRGALDSARSQLSELNNELADQREVITGLEAEKLELETNLDSVTALSENVINIDAQNDALLAEQDQLNREIEALMVMNKELQDDSNQEWFLRGAGTIMLGLLFGFWVARRVYHKRSGWD